MQDGGGGAGLPAPHNPRAGARRGGLTPTSVIVAFLCTIVNRLNCLSFNFVRCGHRAWHAALGPEPGAHVRGAFVLVIEQRERSENDPAFSLKAALEQVAAGT